MFKDAKQFFQQAQAISLSSEEKSEIRGLLVRHRGMQNSHENTMEGLAADEKSDVLHALQLFMLRHPAYDIPPTSNVKLTLTVWEGANLFRCVRPFILEENTARRR